LKPPEFVPLHAGAIEASTSAELAKTRAETVEILFIEKASKSGKRARVV
jgi:hypothetical protein